MFIFIPRDDKPGWGTWINMSHVSHITETPTLVTIRIGESSINVRNDDQIGALKQFLANFGEK